MSVAIVGGDPGLAHDLAAAIDRLGTAVVTINDGNPGDSPIRALHCETTSAGAIESCLTEAAALLPTRPALLRLGVRSTQSVATELASLSLDDWKLRAEGPLQEAFAFHQAAQRFLGRDSSGTAGRIVVVVPTVGLSGGPGFVPLAVTAEADRTLVKAQARVSGAGGVTINCVTVTSALLAGTDDDPDRTGLPAPALPAPGLAQVADVILGLLSSAFDGVTGQTIAVDGGCWMAP